MVNHIKNSTEEISVNANMDEFKAEAENDSIIAANLDREVPKETARQLVNKMPDNSDYYGGLMILDQKEALNLAKEYISTQAQTIIGNQESELADDMKETGEHVHELKYKVLKLRSLLRKTSPTISIKDQKKKDHPDRKDRKFDFYFDMVKMTLCSILGIVALLVSMATMYSVVMNSGIGIFIEKPVLAISSTLALVLGAIGLEFWKYKLNTTKSKNFYEYVIYAITASLILAWIIMFAIIFGSVADQGVNVADMLDFADEDAQNSNGNLMKFYTVIQLLSEFFIGCVFFMNAGNIISRNRATKIIPNPEYIQYEKLLKDFEANFNKANVLLKDFKSRNVTLKTAQKLYHSEQMAKYHRMRKQRVED